MSLRWKEHFLNFLSLYRSKTDPLKQTLKGNLSQSTFWSNHTMHYISKFQSKVLPKQVNRIHLLLQVLVWGWTLRLKILSQVLCLNVDSPVPTFNAVLESLQFSHKERQHKIISFQQCNLPTLSFYRAQSRNDKLNHFQGTSVCIAQGLILLVSKHYCVFQCTKGFQELC